MNQLISLPQAIDMTTLYRQQKEVILKEEFTGQNILCLSETFDRAVFDQVLAQTGCTALRIYYGMDRELKIHAIIVGVNENNEDILPVLSSTDPSHAPATTTEDDDDNDDSGIIETGQRCPDYCPPASDLNP